MLSEPLDTSLSHQTFAFKTIFRRYVFCLTYRQFSAHSSMLSTSVSSTMEDMVDTRGMSFCEQTLTKSLNEGFGVSTKRESLDATGLTFLEEKKK